VNGILPILVGGLLLLFGGFAAVRSAGSQNAGRKQLEERLKELRVQDKIGRPPQSSGLSQNMPHWLAIMLARADIVPQTDKTTLVLIIFAVVAAITGLIFGWLIAIAVFGVELFATFLALRTIAQRRINRFVEDLPFFLDNARQMLTTGSSVQQALTKGTENSSPHMQRYLLPMIRRMQNGAAVGDSATWLAERLDVLELHMFATAIQTNIRYGGRLSQILANLIAVLRDRSRVIRELKAATSETRMSAIVLGALPIVAGIMITLSNASYTQFFFQTTQGNHLILIAVCLQVMGILAMRWLMRLDY
jgi:tight adherence protein B